MASDSESEWEDDYGRLPAGPVTEGTWPVERSGRDGDPTYIKVFIVGPPPVPAEKIAECAAQVRQALAALAPDQGAAGSDEENSGRQWSDLPENVVAMIAERLAWLEPYFSQDLYKVWCKGHWTAGSSHGISHCVDVSITDDHGAVVGKQTIFCQRGSSTARPLETQGGVEVPVVDALTERQAASEEGTWLNNLYRPGKGDAARAVRLAAFRRVQENESERKRRATMRGRYSRAS